jgi:hypothetical protein
MSKYDNLIYYKQTKARTEHICMNCHQLIKSGDIYYAEHIKDKFLHSLHSKKFCKQCYQKMGETNSTK